MMRFAAPGRIAITAATRRFKTDPLPTRQLNAGHLRDQRRGFPSINRRHPVTVEIKSVRGSSTATSHTRWCEFTPLTKQECGCRFFKKFDFVDGAKPATVLPYQRLCDQRAALSLPEPQSRCSECRKPATALLKQ